MPPWCKALSTTRGNAEALGFPALSVSHAIELSPVLAEAAPLDGEDAKRWLVFWCTAGLL